MSQVFKIVNELAGKHEHWLYFMQVVTLLCYLPIQGLKANVLQQFEENARLALQSQNQDSSDRVRSGSYSEAALRR